MVPTGVDGAFPEYEDRSDEAVAAWRAADVLQAAMDALNDEAPNEGDDWDPRDAVIATAEHRRGIAIALRWMAAEIDAEVQNG